MTDPVDGSSSDLAHCGGPAPSAAPPLDPLSAGAPADALSPGAPSPGAWRSGRRGWRHRRSVSVLAAATATALVAVIAFALADNPAGAGRQAADDRTNAAGPSTGGDRPAVPGRWAGGVAAGPAASAPSPATDLVVRDGDTVEASGLVEAKPGGPVRFCAPEPVPLIGGHDQDCQLYVPVTGVNLGTLTHAGRRGAVRVGWGHLRGVWRSGVLAVTRQGPPRPPAETFPEPPALPCARPPGGWKSTGDPDVHAGPDNTAVLTYIQEQHPDQFGRPWVSQPEGMSMVSGTPAPTNGVEVLVVLVVKGDVEQARRELQRRYAGNLCVVGRSGWPSMAEQNGLQESVGRALGPLLSDRANGIWTYGGWSADGARAVRVEMVMLTPALYGKLATIGPAVLDLQPWLRPVH